MTNPSNPPLPRMPRVTTAPKYRIHAILRLDTVEFLNGAAATRNMSRSAYIEDLLDRERKRKR